MKKPLLIMLGLLLFTACSENSDEGVLPTYQKKAMERAADVEDQLQQAADQRREQSESY